jgi:hypothetical protein
LLLFSLLLLLLLWWHNFPKCWVSAVRGIFRAWNWVWKLCTALTFLMLPRRSQSYKSTTTLCIEIASNLFCAQECRQFRSSTLGLLVL